MTSQRCSFVMNPQKIVTNSAGLLSSTEYFHDWPQLHSHWPHFKTLQYARNNSKSKLQVNVTAGHNLMWHTTWKKCFSVLFNKHINLTSNSFSLVWDVTRCSHSFSPLPTCSLIKCKETAELSTLVTYVNVNLQLCTIFTGSICPHIQFLAH